MREINSVQCSKLYLFKFDYPIHFKGQGINLVEGKYGVECLNEWHNMLQN